MSQPITVTTVAEGVARLAWTADHTIDEVRREVAEALVDHARVETLVDPDDQGAQRMATWSGMHREGVMRGVTVDDGPADRIVYARLATDAPVHEPERLPGAAQLVPAPQARDQPDAGARPRRPGAAVPADLQAGLGPARRRRRGRRVAPGRGGPRGRGGARAGHRRRRPAAHRLAAAVGRLGRRRLPGLRRRRARRRGRSTTWSSRSARSATPRSAPSSEVRELAAPTSPPAAIEAALRPARWTTPSRAADGPPTASPRSPTCRVGTAQFAVGGARCLR